MENGRKRLRNVSQFPGSFIKLVYVSNRLAKLNISFLLFLSNREFLKIARPRLIARNLSPSLQNRKKDRFAYLARKLLPEGEAKEETFPFFSSFFFLFATSYEFMRERKKHRIGWMVQNLGHPLITLLLGNLANKGEGSFSTAFRSCLEKLAHTIIAKNDNESSFPPRFSPQFFPPRRAALIDRLAAVCPS